MSLSKNLAELCSLLVDEIFGELASRILVTLLNRGRLTLPQLMQDTSLTTRQLRCGLLVLIQHNLVYYYVDSGSKLAAYDAIPAAAYNLLRIGRILDMVEEAFGDDGPNARDVMQNILVMGQTRIADLRIAYQEKLARQHKAARDGPSGQLDTGDASMHIAARAAGSVLSLSRLDAILSKLADAELVETVAATSFQNPHDTYSEAERRITTANFPGGPKSEKQKTTLGQMVYDSFEEARDEYKSRKRKLLQVGPGPNKRQRIVVKGDVLNGLNYGDHEVRLDGTLAIRINYEKALVDLRNQRLVRFATDMVGENTGRVYGVLLRLLSRRTGRCRHDPILEVMGYGLDSESQDGQTVTTAEILNHLSVSHDLSLGVGKVSSSSLDHRLAENLRPRGPDERSGQDEAEVDGDASSDEETEDESDASSIASTHGPRTNGINPKPQTKGQNLDLLGSEVPETPLAKETRVDQLRRHLLLLCESKQRFVRHCDKNEWTVDFRPLVRTLQESELDVVVERTCGRNGMRLVRILREKGKLDEKSLPSFALMKKADVQNKMLQMQMAGFVDIQEVPRDTNRTASRTIFLWFTDTDRCLGQLLENTYKAMVRTLQTLNVHRQRDEEVLTLAGRSDVRGREKDVMEAATYNKFVRFKDLESQLLGQLMRLDDLVTILRDY